MSALIDRARDYAQRAHATQARKYTGEPYFHHCLEVASLVMAHGGTDEQIAAAYLHDTVEDCDGIELADIGREFGAGVMGLVSDLTDVSRPHDGNRAARKAVDRAHTAAASPAAKSVKLADLISNTMSITRRDPDFARVYLDEKTALMEFLADADIPALWELALRQLPAEYFPTGRAGLPSVWGVKPG